MNVNDDERAILSDDYLDGVERGANLACEYILSHLDLLSDDPLAAMAMVTGWVYQWVGGQEVMRAVSGVPVFVGEVIDGD